LKNKLNSISLVSWALNEEENVVEFISKAHEFCQSVALEYEIIVVDDGSTDNTLSILDEHSRRDPRVSYFSNEQNFGVGFSMKKALSLATNEFLIWQTQDWSYELDSFREIIQAGAIGNRIVHGVRRLDSSLASRSDSKSKALISLCNYWLIKFLFRAPFSDFQNVTLYPQSVYNRYTLVTGSSFTSPELLLRAWNEGIDFIEIPVSFIPRKFGVAKGTKLASIFRSVYEIFYFRICCWPSIRSQKRSSSRISKFHSEKF
jgi:glycosyltransferase involved in cell wall biosynthesis